MENNDSFEFGEAHYNGHIIPSFRIMNNILGAGSLLNGRHAPPPLNCLMAALSDDSFFERTMSCCADPGKRRRIEIASTIIDLRRAEPEREYLWVEVVHNPELRMDEETGLIEYEGARIEFRMPPYGIVPRDEKTMKLIINPLTGLPPETIPPGEVQVYDDELGDTHFFRIAQECFTEGGLEPHEMIVSVGIDYTPHLYDALKNSARISRIRYRSFDINAQLDPRKTPVGGFSRHYEAGHSGITK